MSGLVAAEFLKFRTTRASIGFVLVIVALTGIGAAGTVGGAHRSRARYDRAHATGRLGRRPRGAHRVSRRVLAVTSEWRHGTITRTFLVTPRRARVVLAKEIWIALLALVFRPSRSSSSSRSPSSGSPSRLTGLVVDDGAVRQAGRLVLVSVLWGTLGVGVGAVVQSQTFALVGSVIWILVVEALIAALLSLADLEAVADYLPGRALSAFDGTEGGLSTGRGVPWHSAGSSLWVRSARCAPLGKTSPDVPWLAVAAPVHKGEELDLRVDSLAYGGSGVGRHEGFVVFVRGGLPGDTVRARVTKVKRGFAEGVVTELIAPSASRVSAPCRHFGVCGGCRFQDLAYDIQLEEKARQVRDALVRIGRSPSRRSSQSSRPRHSSDIETNSSTRSRPPRTGSTSASIALGGGTR